MARLNLEKMSFAELSKLRLHVDHLMVEKQTEVPTAKWSELRYGVFGQQEDHHGEAAQTRRDHCEVAAG
jgi:hypothetical protein